MKILVGFDGSNASRDALIVAREHAKAFNAQVEVVTSMMSGTENQKKEIESAERQLEWAQSVFEEHGIDCQTHLLIRGLAPGEDIVKYADENAVDEVVVGVKRRSRVGKILLGSTAQYVIIKAPCPVVSVK